MERQDAAQIIGRNVCHRQEKSFIFPNPHTVDLAAKFGISAIVQPGGSMRDQESIDAANEHAMVMMVTGIRHFKH